jgi:PadR family transcriptional regulator
MIITLPLDSLGPAWYAGPRLSRRLPPLPKSKASLLQGTLDMLILKALSLGALHGYGVGQRIAQISGDALKVEEGSLYPGLYRLEQRGWIESEWDVSENNQRAKFYKLTRAGRKQLIIEEQNWERLAGATMKALRAV